MNLLAKRSCITMQNNRRHEAKKKVWLELLGFFMSSKLNLNVINWPAKLSGRLIGLVLQRKYCKELCIVKWFHFIIMYKTYSRLSFFARWFFLLLKISGNFHNAIQTLNIWTKSSTSKYLVLEYFPILHVHCILIN